MKTFTPRMDILPPAQVALWPLLSPSISLGLVLYGGTAIALRLGHRHSVDFDFFTHKALDTEALAKAFPFLESATTLQDSPNTFTVSVAMDQGPVKLSFFGGIVCGRVGEPEQAEDDVLCAASLQDLLAHKLKVILQRPAAKDYRDIAALLRHGLVLSEGLAAAKSMWPTFQPAVALKALAYYGDGDLATVPADDSTLLVKAAAAVGKLPMVGLAATELTLATE